MMRKALFTALGFNLFVEGLTSLRLITLPRRLDDFDPTTHGGLFFTDSQLSLLR